MYTGRVVEQHVAINLPRHLVMLVIVEEDITNADKRCFHVYIDGTKTHDVKSTDCCVAWFASIVPAPIQPKASNILYTQPR